MAQVYKNVISRNNIGLPTFRVKEPRHSENILAETCYLYRRKASVQENQRAGLRIEVWSSLSKELQNNEGEALS